MKKIILFAFFCFVFFNMYAQRDSSNLPKNVRGLLEGKVAGLSIIHVPKPYAQTQFAVNGKLVGRNNMCINPDDIVAIRNIEDNAAFHKYNIANTDVIEITMKPSAKLFSLNEVLQAFNIPTKDWSLPVFVDEKVIKNRELFVASANYIDTVCLKFDKKAIYISSKRFIVHVGL